MNRRDWLLSEMQINQWVLRKPQVLKGDAQIALPSSIKLVVICEEEQHQSGLFQDILCTLNLNASAFQWINFEQLKRLTFNHNPIFWLIHEDQQAVEMLEKKAKSSILYNHSWQSLLDTQTKRQLWLQLNAFCKHLEDGSHE